MRVLFGVVVAIVAWIAVGVLVFLLLKASWPAYQLAEPEFAFTTAMLWARLVVGVLASVAAGWAATLVARGAVKAAWIFASLLMALSLYNHLLVMWESFPVWFHLTYLIPLLPITGFSGYLARWRPFAKQTLFFKQAPTADSLVD